MKIPPETARKLVWEALFKHDGDREKAAVELKVARRTFDRWIKTLGLYDQIDKMGWTRPGPPRGMPRGSSVIRTQIVVYIRKHKGFVDVPKLAKMLYNDDTRVECQKVWTALYDLKSTGVIQQDPDTGRFTVTGDGRKLVDVPGRR